MTALREQTLAERRAGTTLLRRLREALGLTMGEAARARGVSVSAWCKLELAERPPFEVDERTVELLVSTAEEKQRDVLAMDKKRAARSTSPGSKGNGPQR